MKGLFKGIIVGAVVLVTGLILFLIALGLNGWHFGKNINFETSVFECDGAISKVDIDCDLGSVHTEFYDGDKITVEYPVSKNHSASARQADGVLYVKGIHQKHWYNFWGVHTDIPTVTVKFPANTVCDIQINLDAGEVKLAGGKYGKINADVDAGHADAKNIECSEFTCNLDAGKLDISSVICNKLSLNVDAGSIKVNRIDCPESYIDVDAGTLHAAFVGAKSEYTATVKKHAGSCNIESATGTTNKKIDVKVDAGSVKIEFE